MSFEMNKIIGALLGAGILAMVTGIIAGLLVHPTPLSKPAYVVAGVQPQAEQPAEAAKPKGPEPIEPALATASVDNGKAIAQRVCAACHTFDKGQPNRIGPNLYGIVGDNIASDRADYSFSSALQAHSKDKWTVDLLNEWLNSPQTFAQGTKMTFVGLPKVKDRADMVAYLNSLSDHPAPLPAPPKQP